jgi:hypothetical protein
MPIVPLASSLLEPLSIGSTSSSLEVSYVSQNFQSYGVEKGPIIPSSTYT